MSTFGRGVVTKITVEIEYPDSTRKTLELDHSEEIARLVFDEKDARREDLHLFNVSESDWKQNPSLLVYKKGDGTTEGIPYCTHNGCKK